MLKTNVRVIHPRPRPRPISESLSAATGSCRLSKDGKITDDTRIRETIPTIEYALRRKARVILMAHLGRPNGKRVEGMSLRVIAIRLRTLLNYHVLDDDENVAFSPDCVGPIALELSNNLEAGQTLLLENLRFHAEEEANDPGFAQQLALLCDIYVNDAFGAAHRAHASTEGITHFVSQSAAGLLMDKELTYLSKSHDRAQSPVYCDHRRGESLGQNFRHQRANRPRRHNPHRRRHGLYLPQRPGTDHRQIVA